MPTRDLLPKIDDDPAGGFGPDHDELVGEVLDADTIAALIADGNREGQAVAEVVTVDGDGLVVIEERPR